MTLVVPDTVAPAAGAVMAVEGAVVSTTLLTVTPTADEVAVQLQYAELLLSAGRPREATLDAILRAAGRSGAR